jgi:small GTP-binding protein
MSIKEISWKVCMAGAPGVGKTSLVRRYVENMFSEDYIPTYGVLVSRKVITNASGRITLLLWDVAGDDEFPLSKDPKAAARLQHSYVIGAHAYILVADVSRRATLDQAIARREKIAEDKRANHLREAPFVLALNKSDLDQREFDEREAQHLVPGWEIIATSAKNGDGVARLFEIIAGHAFQPRPDED